MLRKRVPTRRRLRLEHLEDRLCLSAAPVGATAAQPDTANQARLSAAYGRLPLSFEANRGQTDPRVNFLSRGAGYSLFLTPTRAVMELQQGNGGNVVAMKIVGANPASRPFGLDKMSGVSNYLIGNDPSKWHTGVSNYGEVDYQNAYRGIDLVYHGDQGQLEYDFVVKPGANPRAIRLAFDGTQGKTLDAIGNLVLHTSGGDVVEHAPVAYQTINGVQHPVTSRFVLGRAGRVGFEVGRYDRSLPLVIDPVLSLSYSTFLGGTRGDYGNAVAVDGAGNAYLTGVTGGTKFPTTAGAFQSSPGGGTDAFVAKLNPNLSGSASLVYSTFLGGSDDETSRGIAVDAAGDAFVIGTTRSTNFPTKNAYQGYQGGKDVFVSELNPSGTKLLYSTYLGGSGDDIGQGIAVDTAGNAYITGYTYKSGFPTTAGAYQTSGTGAFVSKINPSLSGTASLVYSTLLNGSDGRATFGHSVAVDGSGEAVVVGMTASAAFPTTTGAYQFAPGGNLDAFVTKLNPTGTGLAFSTYLGGAGDDRADAIALDTSGNIYVTGNTSSTNFPTQNAYQPNVASANPDAFVTELSADGARLLYSTYFGGAGNENINETGDLGDPNGHTGGIAVDTSGKIYVTGNTYSADFPTKFPLQGFVVGVSTFDPFVAKFDPAQAGGSSLIYSTILGNSATGAGRGVAAYTDAAGNSFVYVTGWTYASSPGFPTTDNAFQHKKSGTSSYTNAFFSKLAFN
jgi:Beta-propeller repeat